MAVWYKKDWPQFLRIIPELKGIYYGGCIAGLNEPKDVLGHAHYQGIHTGWICVRSKMLLKDHQLLRHEVAHLIAPDDGHDDKWRAVVKKLGGHIDQYVFKYDKRRPGIFVPCFHKACMISNEI